MPVASHPQEALFGSDAAAPSGTAKTSFAAIPVDVPVETSLKAMPNKKAAGIVGVFYYTS